MSKSRKKSKARALKNPAVVGSSHTAKQRA